MEPARRIVTAHVRWWAAAALVVGSATAQESVAPADGGGAARAPAQDGAAEAGRPPRAEPQKLEPLLPAPLLLEKVMRGFLEAAPGRETLDDVMRRAAARNRAAAEAAEAAQRRQFLLQQAQQFEQMLRPLLAAELAFVKRTCPSLPAPTRTEVLAAARQAVREVAARAARVQFEGVGAGAEPLDVRTAIHAQVAAAIEPRVAPEEFAAYERESRLRQERRAETARILIVAKLDEHLGLTAAQRRAVLEDLRIQWRPAWLCELEEHDGVMVNDFPLAPDFADASIVPHLDVAQLRHWRHWSKVARWDSVPRGGVDWSELNAIQQTAPKIDAWWGP